MINNIYFLIEHYGNFVFDGNIMVILIWYNWVCGPEYWFLFCSGLGHFFFLITGEDFGIGTLDNFNNDVSSSTWYWIRSKDK